MSALQPCFKAYDIRGVFPDEINSNFAYCLGRAAAKILKPETAVLGRDARLSSETLEEALALGLYREGVKIFTIGLGGTEEIYHACANNPYQLGIMVTGSHNPKNENGFKLVKGGSLPITFETGLGEIARLVSQMLAETDNKAFPEFAADSARGIKRNHREDYLKKILSVSGFDPEARIRGKRLKILIDAGNGCAATVLRPLQEFLPFDFIEENYMPDGNFPNGVPNPLLPERRAHTSRRIAECGADLGVGFDGDFDRCFFYESKGAFQDGYYIIGILARELLANRPGEKIIHDPRGYWNTREIVHEAGGKPVMGKTGHSFMKAAMRGENAIYGGEMSSHHYFRDFAYCDSGMIAMLLVLRNLMRSGQDLEELTHNMRVRWPISGEINFKADEADEIMNQVWTRYLPYSTYQDKLDGLNMEFGDWRFNLRKSNTENILRLNVESRQNLALLEEKTEELSSFCKT